MKKLLDHSALTGISHVFEMDETTNEVRISAVQDALPLTELNRKQFNERPDRFGDGMQKVASIPMALYMELKASGKLKDQEYMRRWLNDPNNRYFRTRPGRV